jgi:hypothetical protein
MKTIIKYLHSTDNDLPFNLITIPVHCTLVNGRNKVYSILLYSILFYPAKSLSTASLLAVFCIKVLRIRKLIPTIEQLTCVNDELQRCQNRAVRISAIIAATECAHQGTRRCLKAQFVVLVSCWYWFPYTSVADSVVQ